MKRNILAPSLLLAFLLAGCGNAAATPTGWPRQPPTTSNDEEVLNLSGFQNLMAADGSTVEYIGQIGVSYFSVPQHTVRVNGQDVWVFEFPSTDVAQAAAATVSADGWEIGGQPRVWLDDGRTPYFYTAGRIIVIFPRRDQPTIDRLNRTFGASFAGGEG